MSRAELVARDASFLCGKDLDARIDADNGGTQPALIRRRPGGARDLGPSGGCE